MTPAHRGYALTLNNEESYQRQDVLIKLGISGRDIESNAGSEQIIGVMDEIWMNEFLFHVKPELSA